MNLVLVLLALLIVLAGVVTLVGTRLIELRYPAGGTFVPVDGGRLHVMELGPPSRDPTTPPVVLLHGASGNLEDMRVALGAPLAQRHRVILINRPGHGWSDRCGGSGPEPARQAA